MSYLGTVRSKTGKKMQLFTTPQEALDYIHSHGMCKDYFTHDWKPVTVYGVFLKVTQK